MPCFFDEKSIATMDGYTAMVALSGNPSETWSWLDHSLTSLDLGLTGHTIDSKQPSHCAPSPVFAADTAFDFDKAKPMTKFPVDSIPPFTSSEVLLRGMYQVE